VAEPGRRRRAPGARLCAIAGAPPIYQRTLYADADDVVELILGRAFGGTFGGALRALPTTNTAQHRHRHPGCRWVFISASPPREEGGAEEGGVGPDLAGAPRRDPAMVGRRPGDAGEALPPPQ
jgi:hypothetical protein